MADDRRSGKGGMDRRAFIKRASLLGLSATGVAALLAACGGGEQAADDGTSPGAGVSPDGTAAAGQITIGFSLGTLQQRRWQLDRDYVEGKAEELGLRVIVQSAQSDEQLQIDQAQNMIAQDIDALILSPVNVETAAPAARAAADAGIPVVSYNSVVQNAPIDFWVARDNVAVGELQAELAVEAKPEGNYVIVSGAPGVDIAQEKTQGNMNILQPYIDDGSITLISQEYHQEWDPARGLAQVEDALTRTDDQIDAILANYDGYVLSAMEALDAVGLLGETWLGGEDVFEEVAQGIVEDTVAMSAYTDLQEMANTAVEAAQALAQGGTPESDDTIDNGSGEIPGKRISAFAVQNDNMCEFLNDTGWLPVEDVYANVPNDERPEACRT